MHTCIHTYTQTYIHTRRHQRAVRDYMLNEELAPEVFLRSLQKKETGELDDEQENAIWKDPEKFGMEDDDDDEREGEDEDGA